MSAITFGSVKTRCDRQELSLAFGKPGSGGRPLALRAVPVTTRVVRDHRVIAVLASRDMAAECRGSAALDRTYHLELAEAHMTGIGNTPGGAMVAEDIRDLQPWTGHRCGRLCQLWCFDLRPLPRRRRQEIERALDLGDHPGGDPCIAGRHIQLAVPEHGLDDADIDVVLQQVRGEAMTQGMQGHPLGDARHSRRLLEQAAKLTGRHRPITANSREQPALFEWLGGIEAPGPDRPPGSKKAEQILRQLDLAVLLALACPG